MTSPPKIIRRIYNEFCVQIVLCTLILDQCMIYYNICYLERFQSEKLKTFYIMYTIIILYSLFSVYFYRFFGEIKITKTMPR